MNKYLQGILLLLVGFIFGVLVNCDSKEEATSEPTMSIEETLAFAQENIARELFDNYTFNQASLTTAANFLFTVSEMQIYWFKLRKIWNAPNYGKIERDYIINSQEWEKKYEDAQKTPSEFEGGSLAPMDTNMRLNNLLQERLLELQEWGEKAQ